MMNKIRQWAEDHGEIPMTMSQFRIEEERAKEERRDRGAEKFTLELTADELDWLLLEILRSAAIQAQARGLGSKALDIRNTIDQWWEQVSEQGYKPF